MAEAVLSWASVLALVVLFAVVGVRTWRAEHGSARVRDLDRAGVVLAAATLSLLITRVIVAL